MVHGRTWIDPRPPEEMGVFRSDRAAEGTLYMVVTNLTASEFVCGQPMVRNWSRLSYSYHLVGVSEL